jgi:hypothetical protein
MLLPTKQLIAKIEVLSKDLSPAQLENFLDIIDAMTALVEEAKIQAEPKESSKYEVETAATLH